MAKKGKSSGRSGGKGGDRSIYISLSITLVLIVLLLYGLESLRHDIPPQQDQQQETSETAKQQTPKVKRPDKPEGPLAVLPEHSPIQKTYSTPTAKQQQTQQFLRKRQGKLQPMVAIIIDDMGANMAEAESLLAMNIPVTFAVIPGLPHGREVASAAHAKGYDVMLHIPMEPKDYPLRRLEHDGLLLNLPDREIERRLNHYLDLVPHAAGANNHMGSRFTENEGKMRVVLAVLKGRDMFFVDSKTSSASVGERLAGAMGMKRGSRQVFLDNIQDFAAIKSQLEQLAAMARKRGRAIGICHPHPATIRTLAAVLPVLQGEGITFVKASELVH